MYAFSALHVCSWKDSLQLMLGIVQDKQSPIDRLSPKEVAFGQVYIA